MADDNEYRTAFFTAKPGERLGERLTLRLIARSGSRDPKVDEKLREHGLQGPLPSNITVGYYRILPDPAGAVCFMPVPTAAARAALKLRIVQARIARDLLARMHAKFADDDAEHP